MSHDNDQDRGAWTGPFNPFDDADNERFRAKCRAMFLDGWPAIAREMAEDGMPQDKINRAFAFLRDKAAILANQAIIAARTSLAAEPGNTQVH